MALRYPLSENSQPEISEQQLFILLRKEWQPGYHIGIAAPTRWGKTWLMARIMAIREWATVFAMKQEDSSIAQFRGFRVLDSWKDRRYSEKHIIVWPDTRNLNPEQSEAKKLLEGAYHADMVYMERHWTYGIDDLNDACAIGLKRKIASMLRLCGSQKTSIVANYQRPFSIIQEVLDQPQFTLMAFHKDKRSVERLAQANGIDTKRALELNSQLTRYDCILFRPMEEPIIVRRKGS